MSELRRVRGIGPVLAGRLIEIGVSTLTDLAGAEGAVLTKVNGVSPTKAQSFRADAVALIETAAIAAKEDKARKKKKTRKKAVEKFEKKLKKGGKEGRQEKGEKGRKSGSQKEVLGG